MTLSSQTTNGNVVQVTKPYKFETSSEIFSALSKDVLERTGECKYPTGIEDLDRLIWGVHRKELLVIAARPSHGKSSLLINIAWNLAKNNTGCVFLTLEMGRHSVCERIACIEFDIKGWWLRQGVKSEVDKFREIQEKMMGRFINYPLEIIDSMGKNIHEVEQVLCEFKPVVLFIDHAQKISAKGYGNKYEALSDFVNTLQTLAIKYNCAVVLASQINRQGSREGNAMDFMKGSGDIEESADTLLQCKWLVRDKFDHSDREEFEVSVIKQRHGPCDTVKLNFNGGTYKFTNRTEVIREHYADRY